MIDGNTQVTGIIGHPLTYTISPAIHNAAFDACGLNWRYLPLVVDRDNLDAAVAGVRALGLRGVNVTMPHKEAVLPLMDDLDGFAAACGAVNTIVVSGNGLVGENTDGVGFLAGLREACGFDPKGGDVLVVGAGGAARAVVLALAQAGAASVLVANRTAARAVGLVEGLRPHAGACRLAAMGLGPEIAERAAAARLVVKAVPEERDATDELSDKLALSLGPRHAAMDLVYVPRESRFIQAARQRGATACGGLEMLVQQAAASFQLLTGAQAPVEEMRSAAEKALRQRRR